jgi:uncharacterized protein (TIGR03083 family)
MQPVCEEDAVVLPRTDVVEGTPDALDRFEGLLRSLSAEEWATPTRCTGWTVADVAAHVVGNVSLIATGRVGDFADPSHVEREVGLRKGRTPDQLADELHEAGKVVADLLAAFDDDAWNGPPPVAIPGTLGQGVEAIWHDAYVHAEDIRQAIGRPADRDDPGLRVAVSHVADTLDQQGWRPATIALDGMPEFPVSGGGDRITGDPYEFVMAGTGRADPAPLGLDETVNIYRPQ